MDRQKSKIQKSVYKKCASRKKTNPEPERQFFGCRWTKLNQNCWLNGLNAGRRGCYQRQTLGTLTRALLGLAYFNSSSCRMARKKTTSKWRRKTHFSPNVKDYQSTKYVNQEVRSSFGSNMTPNVKSSVHQATPHCPPNKLVSVEKSSVLSLLEKQ